MIPICYISYVTIIFKFVYNQTGNIYFQFTVVNFNISEDIRRGVVVTVVMWRSSRQAARPPSPVIYDVSVFSTNLPTFVYTPRCSTAGKDVILLLYDSRSKNVSCWDLKSLTFRQVVERISPLQHF